MMKNVVDLSVTYLLLAATLHSTRRCQADEWLVRTGERKEISNLSFKNLNINIQNRRLRLIDCSVCSFSVSLQFPFNNASQLHSSSSIHGLRMSCSAPLRMPSVKLIIHFAQPAVDLGHLFIFSRPINWLFEESCRTFEMGEDHHLLRNHHCL